MNSFPADRKINLLVSHFVALPVDHSEQSHTMVTKIFSEHTIISPSLWRRDTQEQDTCGTFWRNYDTGTRTHRVPARWKTIFKTTTRWRTNQPGWLKICPIIQTKFCRLAHVEIDCGIRLSVCRNWQRAFGGVYLGEMEAYESLTGWANRVGNFRITFPLQLSVKTNFQLLRWS